MEEERARQKKELDAAGDGGAPADGAAPAAAPAAPAADEDDADAELRAAIAMSMASMAEPAADDDASPSGGGNDFAEYGGVNPGFDPELALVRHPPILRIAISRLGLRFLHDGPPRASFRTLIAFALPRIE